MVRFSCNYLPITEIFVLRLANRRGSSVDHPLEHQAFGHNIAKILYKKPPDMSASERSALNAFVEHAREGDLVGGHSIDRQARDRKDFQDRTSTFDKKSAAVPAGPRALSLTPARLTPWQCPPVTQRQYTQQDIPDGPCLLMWLVPIPIV
jgi:hypothetical protein